MKFCGKKQKEAKMRDKTTKGNNKQHQHKFTQNEERLGNTGNESNVLP